MNLATDRLRSLLVGDIMSRDVLTVNRRQTMAEAVHAFLGRQISAAPVVDEHNRCVGILSATDVLRVVEQVGGETPADKEATSVASACQPVTTLMTTAVQSIAPNETILQAARIMCAQHVHRLIVLDRRGVPVGVISTMDIVAALVHAIDELDMQRT